MHSASQCQKRSYDLDQKAVNAPTEALRIDLIEMANLWRHMSITAAYQDGMAANEISHLTL